MAQNKKTTLTMKEIDALRTLVCIAKAGDPGEGDYQGFDYQAMERADDKMRAMAQQDSKP